MPQKKPTGAPAPGPPPKETRTVQAGYLLELLVARASILLVSLGARAPQNDGGRGPTGFEGIGFKRFERRRG